MTALFLLSAQAPASDSSWDSLLERDETGEDGSWCGYPPQGWMASDAGVTARHWAENRTIWFFGDTAFPPGDGLEEVGLEANSIAVSPSSPAYTPSSVAFYAKRGTSTRNVTATKGWANQAWMPAAADEKTWYWPGEATVQTGTQKLITFWNAIGCSNGNPFGDCPVTWGWTETVRKNYAKVCTISSVSGSPLYWATPSCTNIAHSTGGGTVSALDIGIEWGAALMEEGGYFYIFGITLSYPYTAWDATPVNVVVARATAGTISNYAAWEFLYYGAQYGSWIAGPPQYSWQLRPVANAPSSAFTVDKITINGKSRYVLVQQYQNQPYVVTRISKDVSGWPYLEWYALPGLGVPESHTWIGDIGHPLIDAPCDGPLVYAMKGQWDISNQAANQMKLSYYCAFVDHNLESNHGNVTPWDLDEDHNPGGVCSTSDAQNSHAYYRGGGDPYDFDPDIDWVSIAGRLRFWNLPLTNLQPWCSSPNCWM